MYSSALDTLLTARSKLEAREFAAEAVKLIQSWGTKLLSEKTFFDPDSLFSQAEKKWKISPTSDRWYQELKSHLLNAEYALVPAKDETLEKRLSIRKSLSDLFPEDKRLRAEYLFLKSEFDQKRGELWEAAEDLRECSESSSNQASSSALKQAVHKAIVHDFRSNNLSRLYAEAQRYQDVISTDFASRYMFARSCLESSDYHAAAENFEWLAFNWQKDQNLVSWESVFDELQSLYRFNLKFDEAFRLNQRIYRQRGTEGSPLLQAIMNQRAKYIMPFLSAWQVFLETVKGTSERSAFFKKSVLTQRPEFLIGIYMMAGDGSLLNSVANKSKILTPSLSVLSGLMRYPSLIDAQKENQRIWLVNKVSDVYVVAEISAKVNENESVLISEIQQNKMNDQPWNKLADYERSIGVRVLSDLLCGIFSIEFPKIGPLDLSRYWESLKAYPYILYMAEHGKSGNIVEQFAFDKRLGNYDSESWKRSSRALAFMVQEIEYDQKYVVDVANPVYVNNVWRAVIRFGFKKM
jgi:hypothetical protein